MKRRQILSARIRGAAITAIMITAARGFAQEADVSQAKTTAEENLKPSRTIVVSIPDRKLAVLENGKVLKVYRTAVGKKRTPSPAGTFHITTRVMNPAWYQPGKVVPPGKNNPVGTRWVGLSAKGFGIHGTNNPASIGSAASKGCIRMKNRDVEELFEMVSIGDVVELHAERSELVARLFPPPAGPQPETVQAKVAPKREAPAAVAVKAEEERRPSTPPVAMALPAGGAAAMIGAGLSTLPR